MALVPLFRRALIGAFVGIVPLVVAKQTAANTAPLFHKIVLSDAFHAEAGTFGDLNRDGHLDAIAGPFWYAGPDFIERHEIYAPAEPFDPLNYSDNFSVFVHDFDADGWPDVLVIGFPGKDASWWKNPGTSGEAWKRHLAFEPVDNESPTFGPFLASDSVALVCMSEGRIGYATPDPARPEAPWIFHAASPTRSWDRFTHGLGFGDIDGDGRADLLEKDGWWQQPASLDGDPEWKHHAVPFGSGAHMHVVDVNGDGLADVVTSRDAHGYGLSWFEQVRESDGTIGFREHEILARIGGKTLDGVQFSQLHAVTIADIDGDGLPDIVTGKRWWAHGPKGDPEPNAAPVLCAFLLRRSESGDVSFEPFIIDDASGVGTQLVAADANGDGRPDLITVNKRGAFLLLSTTESSVLSAP